jgi:hypothetical protein
MTLAVGQRWRYIDGQFNFLVEIIEITALSPMKTQVLQANNFSVDMGYPIGRITGSNGLEESRYQGNVWTYLEGQDKPQ